MNEHRVVDMERWKAVHLRPLSWYSLFYAYHATNLRLLRAWAAFWR